jgi:hypothetical protein
VYKGIMNDVQLVAVKQLKQHDARNDIRFLREIAILKECRSPHVVQFLVRRASVMDQEPCALGFQGSGRRELSGQRLWLPSTSGPAVSALCEP